MPYERPRSSSSITKAEKLLLLKDYATTNLLRRPIPLL